MGSMLAYDLLAAEQAARYRREAQHDRQVALLAAEERLRRLAARPAGDARSTRRGLARALLALAGFGLVGPRRRSR